MISKRASKIGLNELEIFDNFQIDNNLPKHKNNNNNNKFEGGFIINGNDVATDNFFDNTNHTLSFREKLINWFLKKLSKGKTIKKKQSITIIQLFTQLSKSYKELTPIAEIAEYYQNALTQAKIMGQTALLQSLKDNINIVKGEANLIGMKLTKYVTEKQLIKFYDMVGEDNNLKLTWIKNFGRIIPENVYKTKEVVDEREIFDNYVILHYDPENNGEKLTKEEVENKKDPILFGLIENSKKLYYVADWKDDYCELTLEEMFNTLKGKVMTVNNKNVKTYIDKIGS